VVLFMNNGKIWLGAGLLGGLLLAGLVASLSRHPQVSPLASSPAPAAAAAEPPGAPGGAAPNSGNPGAVEGARSSRNDLKLLPPEIREKVERALQEGGAREARVASVDPRNARGEGNLRWVFTPPAADAPEWQRELWDKQMAPLLYPSGHPRAGQYRDSVSAEDVEKAAVPMLEAFYSPDYLDQPMLHVPAKRIDFNELNQAASRLWKREDASTARPFYEWLKAAPESPGAYQSDFWIPAQPGDPEATSYRAWLSEEVRRQAAEQIAQQKSGQGS
jgi:hypothetical protein